MVVASTRTGARAAIAADAVILAVPAAAAAALLARTEPTEPSHWAGAPETAAVLGGFRSASVAMVRLAVRPDRVRAPAGRAGLLVPHRSGFATVAVSYASTKWAHLAEDGLVRLRISVGHDDDPDSPRLPEDELVTRVLDEARTLTGLDGPVEHHSLVRWHGTRFPSTTSVTSTAARPSTQRSPRNYPTSSSPARPTGALVSRGASAKAVGPLRPS